MSKPDVLVVAPFRSPSFRFAIAPSYPLQEPWDSPPFLIAGAAESAGMHTCYLPLLNAFPGYCDSRHGPLLREILSEHHPRVVLFATDHFVASRSTAAVHGMRVVGRMLADRPKRPCIGACGRLATVLGTRMFALCNTLDFVIVGEAEAVLADILPLLVQTDLKRLADHPAVLLRGGGRPSSAVEPAYAEDPSSLPLPAYHLAESAFSVFERATGRSAVKLPFSIRTSFGCRFHCRFCGGVPHWRDYRCKSSERVSRELDLIETHTGGRGRLSFLEDELFTLMPEHCEAICDLLRRRRIMLDGLYTHAAYLTPEVAACLVDVVRRVHLGLDSADDRVLRDMGKGQTLSRVLEAVDTADAAGLKVQLEWIIGTPTESRDNLIHTLNMVYNLLATNAVDSIDTYVFCPHPGTEYAERCALHRLEIVGRLEDMEESGGFPAAITSGLSRNEVFAAYLISQIVIREATVARSANGPAGAVAPANYPALRRLFAAIAGEGEPRTVRPCLPDGAKA